VRPQNLMSLDASLTRTDCHGKDAYWFCQPCLSNLPVVATCTGSCPKFRGSHIDTTCFTCSAKSWAVRLTHYGPNVMLNWKQQAESFRGSPILLFRV
jgi:hypothetical protein